MSGRRAWAGGKFKGDAGHHEDTVDTNETPASFEKNKILTAVKTDFVLSAEIVVISLASVASAPLASQAMALALSGAAMTAGVYGTVGLIVKMDDIGLSILEKGVATGSRALQSFGKGIVDFMPKVLNTLANVGTVAMLAVGGGIFAHHAPAITHLASMAGPAAGVADLGLSTMLGLGIGIFAGVGSGAVAYTIDKMK